MVPINKKTKDFGYYRENSVIKIKSKLKVAKCSFKIYELLYEKLIVVHYDY